MLKSFSVSVGRWFVVDDYVIGIYLNQWRVFSFETKWPQKQKGNIAAESTPFTNYEIII